ncbi:MAG: DUF763 domain-containing protein [Nitrososphaeraceae archaeon]|nr:DUF763 domain-containing protein [Nitrososphaeraceae archaeon]
MKRGSINLPLHGGHAPPYLITLMKELASSISKIIIQEQGTIEYFRKLSDPLWFQAFGCVLGFDWHSSGLTTVVTGVLKQALSYEFHEISITGGKGKNALLPKFEIPKLAEKNYNLSSQNIDKLVYASKMAAKVDNSAIQDGYDLYHHVFVFDKNSNWTIIQQGLNKEHKMARRYHWISDNLKSYLIEPHTGIISSERLDTVLDMTSMDSEECRKTCLDLSKSGEKIIKRSVRQILRPSNQSKLDLWLTEEKRLNFDTKSNNESTIIEEYEMPRRLDWKIFDRIYDVKPQNYEELINVKGVGAGAIRALSLIAELLYGTRASWKDPVKFNYAHGGKDGVPYQIARKTYDKSIIYLSEVIKGSELDRKRRLSALMRLSKYSNEIFRTNDYNFIRQG